MEFVIKCEYENEHGKNVAYISRSCHALYPQLTWETQDKDTELAKRWKTEAGAEAFLKKAKQRLLEIYFPYYQKNRPIPKLTIVRTKELPPPKFIKKKLTGKEIVKIRIEIIRKLIANKWKPNTEYEKDAIDYKDGTGYLIDNEEHYAITLKSSVLTVHDASRQFCKVVSMGYNEIKIENQELLCGKIALKF